MYILRTEKNFIFELQRTLSKFAISCCYTTTYEKLEVKGIFHKLLLCNSLRKIDSSTHFE